MYENLFRRLIFNISKIILLTKTNTYLFILLINLLTCSSTTCMSLVMWMASCLHLFEDLRLDLSPLVYMVSNLFPSASPTSSTSHFPLILPIFTVSVTFLSIIILNIFISCLLSTCFVLCVHSLVSIIYTSIDETQVLNMGVFPFVILFPLYRANFIRLIFQLYLPKLLIICLLIEVNI